MEQPKNNFKIVSDKKARILLPNMLTLIGVCIGLSSIKFALDEKYSLSVIAIILAAMIDGLDGRIARLIKGTSKMGKELDSLGDVISFGVAPALIMYFWNLQYLEKLGWLICLIYVVCVALRLARFNINSNEEPSWEDNFFEGLPSPAGGIIVLMPLVISFSGLGELFFKINYDLLVPILFILKNNSPNPLKLITNGIKTIIPPAGEGNPSKKLSSQEGSSLELMLNLASLSATQTT
jgi:CDP-diacylglycerol--serine O-phosphatidyltransferase